MSIQEYGYLLIGLSAALFAAYMYFEPSWRKDMKEAVDFVAAQLGFVRMSAFNELSASYMDAGAKLAAERSRSAAAWAARDYLLERVQRYEAAAEDTQRVSKPNLDREWLKSLAGDLERAAEVYGNTARKADPQEASYYNGKQLIAVETSSRVRRYLGARLS